MHPCDVADTQERTLLVSSGYCLKWCFAEAEETIFWIKSLFCFLCTEKKSSRCFIKFRLNHWWQMAYYDDTFHTCMDLDSIIYYAINEKVTISPVVIQNILNCVPKMNETFTGLERHGGKWLMKKIIFWGWESLQDLWMQQQWVKQR